MQRTSGQALRTFVSAFNDRDYRAWGPRIMTETALWVDRPTGQTLVGPAGQTQLAESWLSIVPDGTLEIVDVHMGSDFAVAEMAGHGVVGDNGDSPRLPVVEALLRTASPGDRIEVSCCMVVSFDNQRIAESRVYWTARQLASAAPCPQVCALLTAREYGVAIHASTGLHNHEIAKLVGSSPNTVRNQLASVFRKLRVSTRAELAWLMSHSTNVL